MTVANSQSKFELTDSALRLIIHAEHDIAATNLATSAERITASSFGVPNSPEHWRRELALLRIVSTIEAYVDAVSNIRMRRLTSDANKLTSRLVDDFEVSSGKTWSDRHETYVNYHGFSLKSCNGWNGVSAGIEVRNCLVHGLGNLTAQQRGKANLGQLVRAIDVTVGGNRMHLTARTIPKFARGCTLFVRSVDATISLDDS
jgi:hypothetical protein